MGFCAVRLRQRRKLRTCTVAHCTHWRARKSLVSMATAGSRVERRWRAGREISIWRRRIREFVRFTIEWGEENCIIGRDFWNSFVSLGEFLVPLKKIAMSYVSLEKFSDLQRYCFNFFMPFMPLSLVWAQTPSNCTCEKTKIPLSLYMSLNFFSILTTSNEKTQN